MIKRFLKRLISQMVKIDCATIFTRLLKDFAQSELANILSIANQSLTRLLRKINFGTVSLKSANICHHGNFPLQLSVKSMFFRPKNHLFECLISIYHIHTKLPTTVNKHIPQNLFWRFQLHQN